MLQKLRNLSSNAKKKVIVSCAGSITFVVFLFWIFNFSVIFRETLDNTIEKGATAFAAVEENVGKVYNAFEKIMPSNPINNGSTTEEIATTTSTTTPETATTTNLIYDEKIKQ